MKTTKYILTVLIVLGLLAFVVFHLIPQTTGSSSEKQTSNVSQASGNNVTQSEAVSTVPGFSLKNLDGREEQLKDYTGNLILVNFWASWCGPCNEEAPSMEKMYREFRNKGLVVIGISIDHHVSQVKNFVKQYSITFPILLDTNETVASAYGITGVPETFILDRDYKLIKHIIGPLDWTSPDVTNYLTQLLKGER
ncbi:MAG: peroxiredoxin family protein [bacterium]